MREVSLASGTGRWSRIWKGKPWNSSSRTGTQKLGRNQTWTLLFDLMVSSPAFVRDSRSYVCVWKKSEPSHITRRKGKLSSPGSRRAKMYPSTFQGAQNVCFSNRLQLRSYTIIFQTFMFNTIKGSRYACRMCTKHGVHSQK